MSRLVWPTIALALTALAADALAAPADTKKLATPAPPVCDGCHGAHGEGVAAAHVPRLTGQSAEYLKKQLDDFASGVRDNPIMANFAKPLSEAQRQDLAARYAGMSAPLLPATAAATPSQLDRGHWLAYQGDEQRRVQACNGCHGPDGSGVLHSAPYLAGQSAEYIGAALKSFQTGSRKNDAGELMRSVATRLNDNDIAAVSAYFSHAGTAAAPATASR